MSEENQLQSFNHKDLVGKGYPLYNEKGTFITSKKITAAYDMRDTAAIAISLTEDQDDLILIGYKQAVELVNGSK